MHDELRAHGARRAWWWRTALVVFGAPRRRGAHGPRALVDPGWPPADAGVAADLAAYDRAATR